MKQTSGKKGETRADVTVKKLLRMMKQFYDQKMDKLFSFKSKRFRKNQELFLKFTDNFVKKFIRNDFLKLLNINLYVMSEHLAALIQPRSFLVEMETRKKDINLLLESQAEVQS
jgi:vacuolar-type H+-ATPase subunit B/Vma2